SSGGCRWGPRSSCASNGAVASGGPPLSTVTRVQAGSTPEVSDRRVGRRTKIIATVGPASWDVGVLERLIEAGADILRLNFSHADTDRHAATIESIRAAAEPVEREVAVLGDLPGPKLAIGELR